MALKGCGAGEKSLVNLKRTILAAGLGLFFGAGLMAQQMTLSTIRGTALDPSGAAVPGVTIALINLGTSASRSVTSDAAGNFEIPYIQRGTYKLTATITGFKTFVADNIILESGQTRRVDVTLELGGSQTEVTVLADASVITTEGAAISGVITATKYDEIPLVANWFDPTLVMVTMPGIVDSIGGNYALSFNGQAASQLSEGMDGVTYDGPVNQVNNIEDVAELSMVMTSAPAEYSRAGNFNLVSKQGGNEFHGRLYYTHQNDALNARDFFVPEKSKYLVHTFGAHIGGPIIKDKLFFYATWNANRVPSHFFARAAVPTEGMRNGDFSSLLPDIVISDPSTGIPFDGNRIPSTRLNATSLATQDLYIPKPNLGGAEFIGENLGWTHPKAQDAYRQDYLMQRIDYNVSKDNTLYGRYSLRLVPYYLPGGLPNFAWTRNRNHSNLVITDTHVFGPTLVNAFRFGWIKDFYEDGKEVAGYQPPNGNEAVQAIGLEGVNPKGYSAMGFPTMNIAGFSSLYQVPGGIGQDAHDFSYADSVTWSFAKHVMKFGGELKTFKQFVGTVPDSTYGSFGFEGNFSGFSYADFLLGLPNTSSRLDPFTNRTTTAKEFGLFIQDSYKVNPRLSIDYGLRWEYFGAGEYDDGLMYNWDPSTGNVIVPDAAQGSISPLYPSTINVVTGDVVQNPSKSNFRPRVGVAYQVTKDTVLRGGYSMFSEQIGRYARIQGTGPFQLTESFFNEISDGTPLFQFPNPFPSRLGRIPSQSVTGYPFDTHNGKIHQMNVSLEHEWRSIGFRLSYIGALNKGMQYSQNINKPQPSLEPFSSTRRPYSQFVRTSLWKDEGDTKYDAMQFQVQRKMGSVTFDAHYTWARGYSNYLNLENPYAPLYWNQDSVTPRHRVVINAGWQLPFGRGKRYGADAPGVVDAVGGGWMIYYIGFLSAGQRFTPSFSGSDPSNTSSFGGLPDRIADGSLPSGQRALDRWFDTSAFTVPASGRFGNGGVNVLEGPGYNAHHMTFSKKFRLTERWQFEYSCQISNIFNHPNFYFPNNNISIPSVGIVESTVGVWDLQKGGARMMEMKLRIDF